MLEQEQMGISNLGINLFWRLIQGFSNSQHLGYISLLHLPPCLWPLQNFSLVPTRSFPSPVSVRLSPGISFSVVSVVLLNLFVRSLQVLPPNSPVASSIAPESNLSSVFKPAFEPHHHQLLNFLSVWEESFQILWKYREKATNCGSRHPAQK